RLSVFASSHSSFLFIFATRFVFLTRYSNSAFCVLSPVCIRLRRRNYPTPWEKSRCKSSSSTSPSARVAIVSPDPQKCWSNLVAKPQCRKLTF
ncbi:hypothetical protein VIGAN_01136600, partial [Vigna angularis var. angularis]